jgi:hypothetical protein
LNILDAASQVTYFALQYEVFKIRVLDSCDEATQITYKVCRLDDSSVCSEDIGTYSKDYVQLRAEQLTAKYEHKWSLTGKNGLSDAL